MSYKKSRFKEPYNGEKTNFRFTNGKAGVYLVQNAAGKIVYVGMSASNLYKAMYRHFQSWKDRTQVRITYPKQGYKVRVILTTSKQAYRLERALIMKIKPKDNPDKLERFIQSAAEAAELKKYEAKPVDNWEVLENVPF